MGQFTFTVAFTFHREETSLACLRNLKINSLVEEDKQISLLIFRSGSIIITGGKNATDIFDSYNFITEVISKKSNELFYYDIKEEIKQKKKKNKIITN